MILITPFTISQGDKLKTLDDIEQTTDTEIQPIDDSQEGYIDTEDEATDDIDSEEAKAKAAITKSDESLSNLLNDESLVKVQFKNLFGSQATVDRLLGNEPRFVYNSMYKPDPMLVPWIRAEQEAKELLTKATELFQGGDPDGAKKLYDKVILRFPNTTWSNTAIIEIEKINKNEKGADAKAKDIPILPTKIKTELSAILWDETKPLVVIGDDILTTGDTVPQTNVIIKRIDKQSVVFSVNGQDIPVELIGK